MASSSATRKHVRTGCLNCKARHIKCGEEKPSCKQCDLGRWTCEYVTPGPVVRRKPKVQDGAVRSIASMYRPSPVVFVDSRDRPSFDFFQSAASNGMSGYFGGEAWWKLALRASHYEPSVRHAVYASGSLLNTWTMEQESDAPCTAFALAHYNKSIRSFIDGLQWEQQSDQTTLVLCLLFISIELLQNNIDLALHHLQNGIRIATALRSAPQGDRLEPCLSQALMRFEAQARIHSSPTSDFNRTMLNVHLITAGEIPQSFSDVDDARVHLDNIYTSTYSVIRRIKHLTRSSKLNLSSVLTTGQIDSFKTQFKTLGKMLLRWREAFTRLQEQLSNDCIPDTTASICLLELRHMTQLIVLRTVSDPGEMCYDACTQEFVRIVNLVRTFLEARSHLGHVPVSIDSGLIAPLFLVAMKCRVRALRANAIDLLRLCPRREGLWHRDSVLKVVEWKFMREGKDCVETAQRGIIPESARIHSERTEECVIDGVPMMKRRFKQGLEPNERFEVWNAQVSSLTAAMGDML